MGPIDDVGVEGASDTRASKLVIYDDAIDVDEVLVSL